MEADHPPPQRRWKCPWCSMSPLHGEEQQMQGMKDAANELIDVVLNSNSARIALVPFNNFVRLPNENNNYEHWLNDQHRTRFYQLTDIFTGGKTRHCSNGGCLVNNLPPADTDDYSHHQIPLTAE